MAAGNALPTAGAVFVSVRDQDKRDILPVVRALAAMGFVIYCTDGTAAYLSRHSIRTNLVQKIATGARPNVIDMMTSGDIQLVINTPTASGSETDEGRIRSTAVRLSIPMITTAAAARAAVEAIAALRAGDWTVCPLQEHAPDGPKRPDRHPVPGRPLTQPTAGPPGHPARHGHHPRPDPRSTDTPGELQHRRHRPNART
ncbi:MAG: hypothetical protein KatS3mg103_0490 [Phycisphaerales bacterium]|nr:MAG: hypothetical protein KatS3mg103_0490 [Phycisphaerales bacterium]